MSPKSVRFKKKKSAKTAGFYKFLRKNSQKSGVEQKIPHFSSTNVTKICETKKHVTIIYGVLQKNSKKMS